MARGRILDKRLSKSDKFAELKKDRSRVLYCMILPHLDVEGRFSGDPRDIKEDCCPRLQYSKKQIAESIIELNDVGLLILYDANGKPYLEFSKFEDFQTGIRRDREGESKIPAPLPEDSGTTPALYLNLNLSLTQPKKKKEAAATEVFFDFKKKKFLNISTEDQERWGKAYPACNIELCISQAGEWLLGDAKRKKSNYRKFLTNWFKREQDHGGTKGGARPSGPHKKTWIEEAADRGEL